MAWISTSVYTSWSQLQITVVILFHSDQKQHGLDKYKFITFLITAADYCSYPVPFSSVKHSLDKYKCVPFLITAADYCSYPVPF
jgi:hypothetical protein